MFRLFKFFVVLTDNDESQPEGPIIRAEAQKAKAAPFPWVWKFSILEPC